MSDRSLFGTSGIRGSAQDLFTDQFSFDMGRTFALFLKESKQEGSVAIGMDPRDSSPRIKNAVSSGLIYEGFDVRDQGIIPIPAVNYILKMDRLYAGSLMVSGSHIKPELNGLKFFAFTEEILKEHERKLEEIYQREKGKVTYTNLGEKIIKEDRAKLGYSEYIIKKATNYPRWKVVTDTGNGAQSEVFPEVLERLGLNVVKLNASVQLNFLSRDTEVEGDFQDLQKKVIDEGADLGIGFDSDGDRVVFIDEKGEFVPGDYSGTIISQSIGNDKLVTPINTSQVVDHIGKQVYRTKVGSPFVVQKMKDVDALFGFEANGGGIYKEMMSRDGGRSAIEILNLLAKSNAKLSNLFSKLPKFYISRGKIEYNWDLKDKIIDEVKKNFQGIKVEELDGVKIWLDKITWILYRSSQNAPEFRVFAESDDKEKSEKLLSDGLSFVSKLVAGNS